MELSAPGSEAKRICEEYDHAKLVEIDSEEENTAVNNELKRLGRYSAWLGINDHLSEGNWVLVSTGQSLTFSAWRQGEPNNDNNGHYAGGKEENCCLTYPEDKKWNDFPCTDWATIVCEYV